MDPHRRVGENGLPEPERARTTRHAAPEGGGVERLSNRASCHRVLPAADTPRPRSTPGEQDGSPPSSPSHRSAPSLVRPNRRQGSGSFACRSVCIHPTPVARQNVSGGRRGDRRASHALLPFADGHNSPHHRPPARSGRERSCRLRASRRCHRRNLRRGPADRVRGHLHGRLCRSRLRSGFLCGTSGGGRDAHHPPDAGRRSARRQRPRPRHALRAMP